MPKLSSAVAGFSIATGCPIVHQHLLDEGHLKGLSGRAGVTGDIGNVADLRALCLARGLCKENQWPPTVVDMSGVFAVLVNAGVIKQ